VASERDSTTLRVRALPGLQELAALALPFAPEDAAGYDGARNARRILSAPGAGGVLVLTPRWLFFARVARGGDGAAKLTLDVTADLADASTPLGAALAHPASAKSTSSWGGQQAPALVQSAALWASPEGTVHALLGSRGRVLLVPLLAGGALRVARKLTMHSPMRKSDTNAAVHAIDVFRREDGAVSLVTVGSDGDIALAALHDGEELCSDDAWAEQSWHATRRGSGCSKQYCYAPATLLSVHSPSGVAFTGSWNENCAHVYDLESAKATPAAKLLGTLPKLAEGRRVSVFLAKFAPSGLLAYGNSNDRDDATLVLVRPAGK
jgi:hypothetical protein